MRNHRGKIARLSRALQTEVNRRLAAGEPGRILLAWLNAQPEVQTLMLGEFAGKAVNKQNLSQWRLGGFTEWQIHLEADDYCQDLAAHADDLDPILNGRLLRHWDGEVSPEFEQNLRLLGGIMRDVSELRRMKPPQPRVRFRPVKLPARPEPSPVVAPVAPFGATVAH
jgi:hypothetical protein